MPSFVCELIDKEGRSRVQIKEAGSEAEIAALFSRGDLFLVAIREETGMGPKIYRRYKPEDIRSFTIMLGTLLDSGLALKDALSVAAEITQGRGRIKPLMDSLLESVKKGNSFSKALDAYGECFSDFYRGMVKIGERVGSVEKVLPRLASYLTDRKALREKMISALAYPALVCVIAGLGTIGIVIFLVPKLMEIFSELGGAAAERVKSSAALMTNSSIAIGSIIAFIAAGILAATWMRKKDDARAAKIDQLALKTPVLGRFLTAYETLNFAYAMETLVAGGVSVEIGLEEVSRVIGNRAFRNAVSSCREDVIKGEVLSAAIRKHHELPVHVAQWVAIGERSGQVERVFEQIRRYYQGEVDRISELRTPYDTSDGIAAISFEYHRATFPYYAVTFNKVNYDIQGQTPAKQTIRTLIATDGLGRAWVTAKDGEVWNDQTTPKASNPGWNIGGLELYDAMGRTTANYEPTFLAGGALVDGALVQSFINGRSRNYPTTAEYDERGRKCATTLPDLARTTTSWRIADDLLWTRTIDPARTSKDQPIARDQASDHDGNVVQVILDATGPKKTTTRYAYDAIGQMLKAYDANGNAVTMTYDLAGRKTALESPDSGRTEWTFDALGRLARKTDSVLRSKGRWIEYGYDGANRLTKVTYPTTQATTYTYGPAGSGPGAGLATRIDDASGSVETTYGNLGETKTIKRTIKSLSTLGGTKTYTLSYGWDYLGRMASITYPDDETVTYGYDAGGLVTKVSGGKSGIPIDYVEKIGYDEYGQRVYMKYGNGVETQYSYDPERRWLKRIEETSATQEILQNASYTFDKVGNVLTIDDTNRYRTTNKQYEYDTLNQLTSAVQGYSAKLSGEAPKSSNLEQIFRYDTIGNLTYKGSTDVTRPDPSSGARLTYALGYSYDAIHPHRANRVGDFYYRYDDNGNLLSMTTAQTGTEATWGTSGAGGTTSVSGATGSTSGGITLPTGTGYAMSAFGADRASSSGSTSSSGTGGSSGTTSSQNRQYSWDEENRLTEAKYPGKDVRYSYDASGERRVKWTTDRETYYIDKLVQTETSAKEPMMTKHIFLGSTRIATVVTYELAGYAGFEKENRFWYGSDHIGSTTVVTDWQGEEYERLDYTPYGETWVEETKDVLERLNYQFSGKELDRETGLYYYGARYFDPRTSLWISADPALGDYFAVAPTDDDAKKHNENLPGMGGVFNPVNLALYHYAGNNPIRYTDPDGREISDYTRPVARAVIANPAAIFIAQNGWFPGVFNLGGFNRDSGGVFHARQDCLQQFGGYNILYDVAFNLGTSMEAAKFPFSMGGKDYVLWGWKGDYLNLGAGAEMAIYARFEAFGVKTSHWLVDTNLALPMTLTLRDNKGNTVANYRPSEKQWWITGYNPAFQNAKAGDLYASVSIDFSSNKDMYKAFYDAWNGISDSAGHRWTFDNKSYTATLDY